MSIIENADVDKSPYLVSGLILCMFGAAIYVFFPAALLNANFSLLLLVFFGILVATIFGFTLVVSNF